MGTVFPRQSDNMKLIAVLALAAVAFAEPEADPKADPWLTYGYAGYGLPYAGVYGGYRTYGAYPYSYGYYGKRSAEAEPEAEADPALLYGAYGYAGYPYAGVYGAGYRTYGAYPYSYAYYGKRSAEAEADPALLYGAYGYGLPYSGVYGGYRTYGAYPYSYGYYGKRSAEAEPEAEADPAVLYSTAHVAAPLTTAYTHAVAAPAVTHTAAVPAVATTAVNTVKTVVPTYATGLYNGHPWYAYGKRSADAEADPALLYTAGVAPLAYTHHAVAAPAVAAYTVPVATVAKAPAHGVAAT